MRESRGCDKANGNHDDHGFSCPPMSYHSCLFLSADSDFKCLLQAGYGYVDGWIALGVFGFCASYHILQDASALTCIYSTKFPIYRAFLDGVGQIQKEFFIFDNRIE